MKEYTVKEFVEGYEKCTDAVERQRYIEENVEVTNHYISFVSKVNLCDLLVDTTCKDRFGNIRFDSATREMLYKLNLINMYTNINIEFKNNDNPLYDQYDLLQKYNLVISIFRIIPVEEQDEFENILMEKLNDFMDNNCSTSVCINRHVERIRDLGAALLNPLIDELDRKLPEILNNMNNKDIEQIIKRIVG